MCFVEADLQITLHFVITAKYKRLRSYNDLKTTKIKNPREVIPKYKLVSNARHLLAYIYYTSFTSLPFQVCRRVLISLDIFLRQDLREP